MAGPSLCKSKFLLTEHPKPPNLLHADSALDLCAHESRLQFSVPFCAHFQVLTRLLLVVRVHSVEVTHLQQHRDTILSRQSRIKLSKFNSSMNQSTLLSLTCTHTPSSAIHTHLAFSPMYKLAVRFLGTSRVSCEPVNTPSQIHFGEIITRPQRSFGEQKKHATCTHISVKNHIHTHHGHSSISAGFTSGSARTRGTALSLSSSGPCSPSASPSLSLSPCSPSP